MTVLQKPILTSDSITKTHSDKWQSYKNPFWQVTVLQKPILTSDSITKTHSDKWQSYKNPFYYKNPFWQVTVPNILTNDNFRILTNACSPNYLDWIGLASLVTTSTWYMWPGMVEMLLKQVLLLTVNSIWFAVNSTTVFSALYDKDE